MSENGDSAREARLRDRVKELEGALREALEGHRIDVDRLYGVLDGDGGGGER